MTLKVIEEECINCDLCVPACPDGGVSYDKNRNTFVVDTEKCTECIERDGVHQCASMCPVDCMEVDSEKKESKEDLWLKVEKNKTTPKIS